METMGAPVFYRVACVALLASLVAGCGERQDASLDLIDTAIDS